MSRSYHVTVAQLEKLRKAEFKDDSEKKRRVVLLKESLDAKRTVKTAELKWRRQPEEFLVSDIDTIPIIVESKRKSVHHGLSAADVAAILKVLPRGVADGLASITICLGSEHQEESWDVDPLVGRFGANLTAGIYSGECYGCYYPDSAKVFVFGWVFEDNDELAATVMPYLRVRSLSTLLHEIAHHYANKEGPGRARWSTRSDISHEIYAERMQYTWMHEYGLPYLLATYADDFERFIDWMRIWGGVRLHLEDLVPEVRSTTKDGSIPCRVFFSLDNGVRNLIDDVHVGKDKQYCQREFARWIATSDRYDLALQRNTVMLQSEPQDLLLLLERVRIFTLLKDYNQAREVLAVARTLAPDDRSVLYAVCNLDYKESDWHSLMRDARKFLDVTYYGSTSWFKAWRFIGHAAINLDDKHALKETTDSLSETGSQMGIRFIKSLKKVET
jgi:hypothetical protein